MTKKSFLLHSDLFHSVGHLPNEKLGELFRAILEFHFTKNTTGKSGKFGISGKKLSPEVDMAFNFLKVQFERESEKYQAIVERNKANISKRWQKKNTKDTTGKTGIPKIPEVTKNTDNDSDNDIIKKINPNGLIKENPKTQDSEKPKKQKFQIPTLEEIKTYATEANLFCNCEEFFDHYTTNGWKQSSGNLIKDWQAALRNWDRREVKFATPEQLKARQQAMQNLAPKQETEIDKIRRKIIEEQGFKGSEIINFENRFSNLQKGKNGLFLVANHPHDFEVLSRNYGDLLQKYLIKVVIGYDGFEKGKLLIN